MSVCFKRSAAAFKFHMPLPGPAQMQTRQQVLRELEETDTKPTDQKTASDAIKRRERESVEVIHMSFSTGTSARLARAASATPPTAAATPVHEACGPEVATSKAISSKTRASWRQWLSAAEKEALAQKKAVAAAVAKPEEKEIKRSRTR